MLLLELLSLEVLNLTLERGVDLLIASVSDDLLGIRHLLLLDRSSRGLYQAVIFDHLTADF